ncbi:MAG: hypothetical protein Q9226_000165 [Calogaya cf. arnoldii]
MAFSNTRPLNAFPAKAASAQNQVTVEEFKSIPCSACDFSLSSDKTKKYNRVQVLLTHWDEDDLKQIPARGNEAALAWMTRELMELMTGTDSNDLLTFYYGGHGRGGRTPDEGPCILISGKYQVGHWMVDTELDFAAAKKPTLNAASADVLYLLDSWPLTRSAIVQELNQAVSTKHFLAAAQLYFKLLVYKPQLDVTPAHVEPSTGLQPRTSIFLAPLGNDSTVPYPPALRQLANKSSDIRATLFVCVRNEDHHPTLQNMRHWLTTDRPNKMEEIDVLIDHAASSASITILVSSISITIYYSLRTHRAISFMAYVRSSSCVDKPFREGDDSRCRGGEYRSERLRG